MAVYTVHAPPPKQYDQAADAERFMLVRDGFSFWAFVLGPLWMLRHRMWLVLLGYVAVTAALELMFGLLNLALPIRFAAGSLLGLLVGIEAPTLRRFTLGRRGWTNMGVIVADDLEAAERRFFDAWVKSGGVAPRAAVVPPPRQTGATPDVIGLFPQAGPRR